MESAEDHEMHEGESEGETEGDEEHGNMERILDLEMTPLKALEIQSSSSSSSSSRDDEGEGHKDLESEPSNAA